MLAATVVDIGMMLLSAVLSAGIPSVLVMIVITGAIPVLAIATVSAIEGGMKGHSVWPVTRHGSELTTLAARLAPAGRERSRPHPANVRHARPSPNGLTSLLLNHANRAVDVAALRQTQPDRRCPEDHP
jgi:hypothetical protein